MRHIFHIVLFALPLTAWAQFPALTEAEALRRALSREEVSDLESGTIGAAEADAQAAHLISNPTLAYSRERMRGTAGSTDESWQISQTFDLSGRRGLRQEAAARRVDAAVASNKVRRIEVVAETRRRFYEVVLAQQTIHAVSNWTQRFASVEAIVDKLARAGEASGYDRRRLIRERQLAEARLATERAMIDRSRARLAALLGAPESLGDHVVGFLLPPSPPILEKALAALDRRPDLQLLARRAEAADLDGRAAARGWVPDITLGVGTKHSDNGMLQNSGAIVSLSIPLPLFDRQQTGEKRSAAEALNARAEYALARGRADGDLRGLYAQMQRLIVAATDYRVRVTSATPELLRIAEAAYRGGESSLLELLDAYRGALEAETTALGLEWKARDARIDYDLLTGSIAE